MLHRRSFAILAVLIAVACSSGRDYAAFSFTIMPGEQPQFCLLDANDNLIVHVQNNGVLATPPAFVEVSFGKNPPVSRPLPSIAPNGAATEVRIPFPSCCFDTTDHGFTIRVVNRTGVRRRTIYTSVTGLCIG